MIDKEPLIESLLAEFGPQIGSDLPKYKNHVYRVYLNCRLLDHDVANFEAYAIAAVFHDIGIWTDRTIDYLDPSIQQVRTYLNSNGRESLEAEISLMIDWHHKIGKYRGSFAGSVETFRKADWIDVSLGILSFGIDKRVLRRNRRALPNRGFHLFLLRKILRNFFLHPLNPLPMFKW
nr:hypothetical protein [uncultured Dyadobacter sp.]